MTKLQSKIEAIPVEEQQKLVSKTEDGIFELTEAELLELDRRMLNLGNEPTYGSEEVFSGLYKKYV